MATSIFPGGVISWVPRINNVDTVWANDPNSLANEIVAIEQTVGTNPQIETGISIGTPVSYANVSSRIAAASRGDNVPFVALQNQSSTPVRHSSRLFNTYNLVSDPYSMYNGTDVTIKCDGIWLLQADAYWDSQNANPSGFNLQILHIDGHWKQVDTWRWDYPNSSQWPSDVVGNNGINKINWQGQLHVGDRIQIMSINGSTLNPMNIVYCSLRMVMVRQLPPTGSTSISSTPAS